MITQTVTENIATMGSSKLQIGIINLMPKPSVYHMELLQALEPLQSAAQFHWIRLESKDYADDDASFLNDSYKTFHTTHREVNLDAIILSGAPVELVEYNTVDYWEELEKILNQVIVEQLSSLGICWGALAIGKLLGIDKESLDNKVFGVLANRPGRHRTAEDKAVPNYMPFSIQARFKADHVAANISNGMVKVVAHANGVENSILESSCGRHIMCLGHPEYGPNRLLDEWHRDSKKIPSRSKPVGIDVSAPDDFWRQESNRFFQNWLNQIQQREQFGWVTTAQLADNDTITTSDKDIEDPLT